MRRMGGSGPEGTTMRVLIAAAVMAMLGLGAARAQDGALAGSATLQELIAEQQADEQPAEAPETLLAAEELDALVAPVALYPDALLAQVLVAATYPLQVVQADRLVAASAEMSEDELRAALAEQEWDPSVLVLMSGFPTVLQRMAEDLDWTERLGDAMLAQDEDLLAAVQRMRTQAEETGYLTTNAAQVVEEEAGQIAIRPADPEVVYVPRYDSAAFLSTRDVAPYATLPRRGYMADPLVAGAVAFGTALLVGEIFGEDDDGGGDGWDDYRRRQGAIDWRQREIYPRPVNRGDRDHAWSRERDRYWDRGERRWRRNHAEDRKRSRDAADWAAMFDRRETAGARRHRDVLTPEEIWVRDQDAARRLRADERREERAERRAADERRAARRVEEEREKQAKAAAREAKKAGVAARKAEAKAAERAEKRAKVAAREQKAAKAAAREDRAKAAERAERQAKAAAQDEKKARKEAKAAAREAAKQQERQEAKAAKKQKKAAKRACREAGEKDCKQGG
jgi:hypothetical protein